MSTLAETFVRVRPDLREFEPDLRKGIGRADASNAAQKAGRKAGDGFTDGFGKTTKRVVGIATGLLAAVQVKNFLGESTQGYREHLKVAAITTQAIKTTGGAAKVSAGQVEKLSDAIERKTGVDGDAIQSGANLLLTFTNVRNEAGKGNQIFDQSTALLADMSVALGQDAKGSAIQLGKALNDPVKGVTALSKVGVSFTEQQKKQIKTLVDSGNVLGAQKIILAELSKEFGGAAAAAADPADRAKVAYHQLQDEIGSNTLPIVNQLSTAFADRLTPALLDIAEKHGPGVQKFLLGVLPAATAVADILFKGEFNGGIRKALGGLEEDSRPVDALFRIREGAISVHNALQTLATGDFTGRIFGQEEDSPTATALLRIHDAASDVYETLRVLATGDFRKQIFGQEEDSPFVDLLFKVREGVGQLFESLKTADGQKLKEMFLSAADSAGKLLPLVVDFIQQMPGLSDVVGGAVNVLAFLADHTETLRKVLPFLVAAVLAYKAAQLAANVAALLSVPTKIAEVVVNKQLVRSNRELIASRAALTVTQGAGTVVTAASTVATGANTAAGTLNTTMTVRQRIAALASAAAQKAVAGATAAWTVVQRALNLALIANPIGLIITAIGLLVVGIVIAYKKSETFRRIVDGAFRGVQAAAAFAFNWVKNNWPLILAIITGPVGIAVLAVAKNWTAIKDGARTALKFVVDKFLGFVEIMISGAAKAFGWVPGLGGKLKGAAEAFARFRDDVNARLDGIKDQTITIRPSVAAATAARKQTQDRGHAILAAGGPVPGWSPTKTADNIPIMGTANEHMWTVDEVHAVGGHGVMKRMRADALAGAFKGYAKGGAIGRAGLSIRTPLPPTDAFASNVATVARAVATPIAQELGNKFAAAQLSVSGPAGPPGSAQNFRGQRLNQRTIQMLLAAERLLGRVFRITQGSYSTRVAASGSTHAGGGAMDTNGPGGWYKAQNALRKVGFASWVRLPSQGPWGQHIHSIAIGDSSASPAAKRQVKDFLRGGDGLGGFGKIVSRDKGGLLPHGFAALNTSGKSERVLTSRQNTALERIASASPAKLAGKEYGIVSLPNSELKRLKELLPKLTGAFEVLKDRIGKTASRIQDLVQQRNEFGAASAASFTGSVFGQGSVVGLKNQLDQQASDARGFTASLKTLQAKGFKGAIFSELAKSSDFMSAEQLAKMTPAELAALTKSFNSRNTAAQQLASFTGGVQFGPQIATAQKQLKAEQAQAKQLLDKIHNVQAVIKAPVTVIVKDADGKLVGTMRGEIKSSAASNARSRPPAPKRG
jgi:hypothetical protein